MDKEKIIARIMKECEADGEPVTRKEAEEMAEMEIKADGIKNYTQSDVEKKPRKKREVKKDTEKVAFINFLEYLLLTNNVENVKIVNEQKEITFTIGTSNYSLSLIKHRPKKGV